MEPNLAPIEIGLAYVGDASSTNKNLGGNGNSEASESGKVLKALVADMNKHGGFGGHKVVPIFYAYAQGSTQPSDAQEQAACQAFTQDHHAKLVISHLDDPVLKDCLNKAGATLVYDSLSDDDAEQFRKYPSFFQPSGMNLDRILTNEVPDEIECANA